MPVTDHGTISRILSGLIEKNALDTRFIFAEENGELLQLGRGAFSAVYEVCEKNSPGRHYAAKVMVSYGDETEYCSNIRKTVQYQYYLGEHSENVIKISALWELKVLTDCNLNITDILPVTQDADGENVFLVQILIMEKLSPVISSDRYGNRKTVINELQTQDGVIKFAEQIGSALFEAHGSSIFHRDIKLENIFYDEVNCIYKLGDFGSAGYTESGSASTVILTDGYGAPEIKNRLRESYDCTADIYSLGITLYLLLNDLKFPASEGYYCSRMQYSDGFIIPPPENGSERLTEIIQKMCSYRPEERYHSAEEFLMDIGTLNGYYTKSSGFTVYSQSETCTGTAGTAETADDTQAAVSGSDVSGESRESESRIRERKKKYKKTSDRHNFFLDLRTALICSVLFMLVFSGISAQAACCAKWQFFFLPYVFAAHSVLRRFRTNHIWSGLLSVVLSVYTMKVTGARFPVITMMLSSLLPGAAALETGCALGAAAWSLAVVFEKTGLIGFADRFHLELIAAPAAVLVFLYSFLTRYPDTLEEYEEIYGKEEEDISD